jgi:hypothetical protein
MDLTERFRAAEKAADAHIAEIQAARQEVESALARLEALVGNGGSIWEPVAEAPKPNGQGNLHGPSELSCANSRCARKFQPRSGRQKYCCRNCSRAVWDRKQRKVEKPAADAAGPCTG